MIEVWRTLAFRLNYKANVSGFCCCLYLWQVHVACSFSKSFRHHYQLAAESSGWLLYFCREEKNLKSEREFVCFRAIFTSLDAAKSLETRFCCCIWFWQQHAQFCPACVVICISICACVIGIHLHMHEIRFAYGLIFDLPPSLPASSITLSLVLFWWRAHCICPGRFLQ